MRSQVLLVLVSVLLTSCGKGDVATAMAKMTDQAVGSCLATIMFSVKNNFPVRKSQITFMKEVEDRYDSTKKVIFENCLDPNGNMIEECIKTKLSPADFSFTLGYVSTTNFLNGPQNPSLSNNREMANMAYCSSLD